MRSTRLPLLVAVAALSLARVAWAADPSAPLVTAPDDGTGAQIDSWLADDRAPDAGDMGGAPAAQAEPGPRTIHGSATVGIGSGGYREADVAAIIPIGETGDLGVAVGQESFRGYTRRNVALSLALGTGAAQEPCGLRHTGIQLAGDAARQARCAGLDQAP